jgi:hypothetical protein
MCYYFPNTIVCFEKKKLQLLKACELTMLPNIMENDARVDNGTQHSLVWKWWQNQRVGRNTEDTSPKKVYRE